VVKSIWRIMFKCLILFLLPFAMICGETYREAGVDIDAGDALVESIKPLAALTARRGGDAMLGGFGAFFDLAQIDYEDPILVSTTDGVGTKLKIAQAMKNHKTIGIDLVAMSVNDLIVHGAEPLFFLDYYATGALNVAEATEVIEGIAKGCQQSGCVLSGGETAEMPGFYAPEEYDLAGFAVGVVERSQWLPKLQSIENGDVVLGLASSGVHSNGFSLIRSILHRQKIDLAAPVPFPSSHRTVGEALLQPTRIYVRPLLPLIKKGLIKAMAHMTGGGLIENIPRILPEHAAVELNANEWEIPSIFHWIAQLGNVNEKEMQRTFNLGIGMALIVAEHEAANVQKELEQSGERVFRIGKVIPVESQQEKVFIQNYPKSRRKILVVGGGGREHALAWKIAQSPLVERVFVAPGNGGTSEERKVENIPLHPTDIDGLIAFAQKNGVDFILPGSEVSLDAGIVDASSEAGLRCFGPTRKAARLETSKIFSKEFMKRHSIPTARYQSFSDFQEASLYVQQQKMPIVIKADGLAGGKGVIIAKDQGEALAALRQMMIDTAFADAGERVVIEEFLEGEELTFIVATDGETILPLATSQDHKKRDNGDRGPNTGGMGAYSPVSLFTGEMEIEILQKIMMPAIHGMAEEGCPYRGFLYAGLMITKEGPKVLEFNCRLGDPEAQAILIRLQSDLIPVCDAVIDGRLNTISLQWDPRSALCVVLTTGDYPGSSHGKDRIQGLSGPDGNDLKIFHAQSIKVDNDFYTAGGRILSVTALGNCIEEAHDRAYESVRHIEWPRIHFRSDIGFKELARSQRDQK
jgi:phosphoribosylamine--glycine ligase